MRTNGNEPNETAALAAAGEATEPAATVSPGTGRLARFRPRLGVGSRFARHLLEMVIAMIGGMAVLGAALGALGDRPATPTRSWSTAFLWRRRSSSSEQLAEGALPLGARWPQGSQLPCGRRASSMRCTRSAEAGAPSTPFNVASDGAAAYARVPVCLLAAVQLLSPYHGPPVDRCGRGCPRRHLARRVHGTRRDRQGSEARMPKQRGEFVGGEYPGFLEHPRCRLTRRTLGIAAKPPPSHGGGLVILYYTFWHTAPSSGPSPLKRDLPRPHRNVARYDIPIRDRSLRMTS